MADIVIRGVNAPKYCNSCDFTLWDSNAGEDRCFFTDEYTSANYNKLHGLRPILNLPDGHGRLIDADELMNRARGCLDELTILSLEFLVNGSSTIVPAEGG